MHFFCDMMILESGFSETTNQNFSRSEVIKLSPNEISFVISPRFTDYRMFFSKSRELRGEANRALTTIHLRSLIFLLSAY